MFCAGHIGVYRSGIFQLHFTVDFPSVVGYQRDLGISQGSASLPILRIGIYRYMYIYIDMPVYTYIYMYRNLCTDTYIFMIHVYFQ